LPDKQPGTDPNNPQPDPAPRIQPLPSPGPVTDPPPLLPEPLPKTRPGTDIQTGDPLPQELPVPNSDPQVIHYPAGPVIGTGTAPQPNLQSIADELGKQEVKLAMLLNRPSGSGGDVATALEVEGLRELAQRIYDTVKGFTTGETYRLHPPCGTKPNGDPLDPVEVVVPDAITSTGALINRLDAIAELIDVQMSIRQPICKGKTTGEPVTVHFVQV
jgi:hypothetical protein